MGDTSDDDEYVGVTAIKATSSGVETVFLLLLPSLQTAPNNAATPKGSKVKRAQH
jgi:hypothetical protein